MRRIFETCPELKYTLKYNSTGDLCAGGETCGKELRVKFESPEMFEGEYTGRLYQILQCGHTRYVEEQKWNSRPEAGRNALWDKLLPKQKEAVQFAEETNFNCYLDMQMGTGKTPVSLSILRENLEQLTPCLIITEAGDIHRWQKEAVKWLGISKLDPTNLMGILELMPQILHKKQASAACLSKITITSWTNISDPKFIAMLYKAGYKCIIADEAHMFKNEDSQRSQAFIKLCSFIPHRLFLSGTWIENNLEEAFVPLNVLDPNFFNSRSALTNYCVISRSGKILSLHPDRRKYFFARIQRYVYKLTKAELGIPLPRLFSYSRKNRPARWIDPQKFKGNIELMEEYNSIADKIEDELNANQPSSSTIIGLMSEIRHATGKMKVRSIAEFVIYRLMELPPEEKICIGTHHQSVMIWLRQLLEAAGVKVLTMSSESAEEKDAIEAEFKKPQNRVLIASILGAGKGRNLQFCKNFIIAERQWNRSKEVQFEERFHRIKVDAEDNIISKFTEDDDVVGDYIMASNSFDEYFDTLVNLKGEIVKSIDSTISSEDTPSVSFIIDLAHMVVGSRLKYVGA
jgi:SNF2 family DNA or RNA helicase